MFPKTLEYAFRVIVYPVLFTGTVIASIFFAGCDGYLPPDGKGKWVKNDSTFGDFEAALQNANSCRVLILRNVMPSGRSISHPKSIDNRISKLTALHTLVIYGLAQDAIPEEIVRLSQLRRIEIQGYGLVRQPISIPADLSKLENLNSLTIAQCSLKTIPKLPVSLKELELANNLISQIPLAVFELAIERLDLGYNQITELPESIEKNVDLKWLDISENQVTNIEPLEYHLPNLRFLSISGNPLELRVAIEKGSEPSGPPLFPSLNRLEAVTINHTQVFRLVSSSTKHVWLSRPQDPMGAELLKQRYPAVRFMWFRQSEFGAIFREQ